MNTRRAIFVRGIMRCLPETMFFGLKSLLWRWAGVKIGKNVRICSSVLILGSGELEIGEDTWIGHQVFIETGSKVSIGAYVDIAPRVYIGTGSHKIDSAGLHSAGTGISKPVTIENGVWIGANATILSGVTVGKKTVVGAGAVVTKNVASCVVAVGCPAKVLHKI